MLDISQWALLFGAVMPVVVGIVTKANASANFKAVTLLVLNAVTAVMTEYFAASPGFDWKGTLVNTLAGLVTSVAMYYGVLKHSGNLGINDATANMGMGGKGSHEA